MFWNHFQDWCQLSYTCSYTAYTHDPCQYINNPKPKSPKDDDQRPTVAPEVVNIDTPWPRWGRKGQHHHNSRALVCQYKSLSMCTLLYQPTYICNYEHKSISVYIHTCIYIYVYIYTYEKWTGHSWCNIEQPDTRVIWYIIIFILIHIVAAGHLL